MAVSLVVLLSSNVFYCIAAGVADSSTLRVRDELLTYQANGRLPMPIVWQSIQQELLDASTLMPYAPQYNEGQGYLFALRGISALRFKELALPNLKNAELNYRLAIIKRPMTSSNWANLALVSYYADSSRVADIDRLSDDAMRFGPVDYATQISLFYLGMLRWDNLSMLRRAQVELALKNAKEPLKTKLKEVAHQFNKNQLPNN